MAHIFDCEKEGRDLCDWLNENQKLACGKRVAALIENINKGWPEWRYEDLGIKVTFPGGRSFTGKIQEIDILDLPTRVRPDTSALAKVQRELARHKMRPMIMGRAAVPRKQKNIKPQMNTGFWWTWDYGKDPATRAVHLLMQLCEAGYFSRIRNCKKCTAWFFAKYRHQVFCSQKCQIAHYRRTDKFKAHHRDYTRTLRRRKRQGK